MVVFINIYAAEVQLPSQFEICTTRQEARLLGEPLTRNIDNGEVIQVIQIESEV